jgi:hypothetical protein
MELSGLIIQIIGMKIAKRKGRVPLEWFALFSKQFTLPFHPKGVGDNLIIYYIN